MVDSTRALLVWEPKRIVPTYAVPVEDVLGDIGEVGRRRRRHRVEPPVTAPGGGRVTDHYAFFNERLDVSVDGVLLERPVAPCRRAEYGDVRGQPE